MQFTVKGNLADVHRREIYPAEIAVENGRIKSITRISETGVSGFILPGFIDSHVHIESSMLIPAEFARLAVVHGTVATVSDPHEIANVCGLEGVEYMIENGKKSPFKFYFGAPSCVPATKFETAGADLDSRQVSALLQRDDVHYLSEMMNFPGVINDDPEVIAKINAAKACNKPVDGHAPGLRGEAAKKYAAAGISTDHECFTREEAREKLRLGMKILIREGSAAKNFEALIDLLNDFPDDIMFCSDDKHPDSLVEGHINQLCARAVSKGIDVFNILQAACVNPADHYRLDVGLLRENDPADFIVVKDLMQFEVLQTYIQGSLVAENGRTKIAGETETVLINNFSCSLKSISDFEIQAPRNRDFRISVIEALDGQLITNKLLLPGKVMDGQVVCDPDNDILKVVVVNRYRDAVIAKAFIRNFGLRTGAIASSVAHDSHNIIAVGTNDDSLCRAVNLIIENQGGISCTGENTESVLPLPVAGLMSEKDGYEVAGQYSAIDAAAKALGCSLNSPFMTLSFMALLVIPDLKLSDLGLFDGVDFKLTDLFIEGR